MQTRFSNEQLRVEKIQEANEILRTCLHCGFCTATCPTYKLLGDERDSPRGRIYLIKEMLENNRPADAQTQFHMDRCLSCLSCMTTCPSGVDYMHLADIARQHIEDTGYRSIRDRFIRSVLKNILPYPSRLKGMMYLGRLFKPFRHVFSKIGLKEFKIMLELIPAKLATKNIKKRYDVSIDKKTFLKRVILMEGCVQQVLRPSINEATARLLNRFGVEVVISPKEACCGALALHMGQETEAKISAKNNVDAWLPNLTSERFDALIITASGCGTVVKDYDHLLAEEEEYHARSKVVSKLAIDISEFLESVNFQPSRKISGIRVVYHSACSLKHGQRVTEEPIRLLRSAGFEVFEPIESHICCGSAGTYNILQPDISVQLRDRKLDHILSLEPDVIATGNIGCLTQISSGTNIPVVHTVELLDWASGGPCPFSLKETLERKA
jgi:glycolate oxidase iron-sulfur subunit